jgi:lysyl-tRNA synthetase class 2
MNLEANWQPTAVRATLETRAAMLTTAREFFSHRGILEVETPILCEQSVTDPHVSSIATAAGGQKIWLRTSPEYHMKRLLAAGYGDIYQIGKAFRGGESGPRHQPEFTMIEWYRHNFELPDIIAETCELIFALSSHCQTPATTVTQVSYPDAFSSACGIDPLTAEIAELRACAANAAGGHQDSHLAEQLGDDRQGWLDLLASTLVYPKFNDGGLWVLDQYPADQAMLARLNPNNPALADRFEIFWQGTELANGFRELRDAGEQQERFAADQRVRRSAGLPAMEIDGRLLAALESGLPECAGVAVGLDRILLIAEDLGTLDKTMSFVPGK